MKIVTKSAASCSYVEFGAFVACVRAGDEVAAQGLSDLIRAAPALVFAYTDAGLAGVAALKLPRNSYRARISKASEFALSSTEFPFELGWVFILPDARGQGLSFQLSSAALAAQPSAGTFATTRTENKQMQRTLAKLGFLESGHPYASGRQHQLIQLHVRRATQQSVPDRREDAAPG